jgi:hypothetical protein
MDESCTLLYTVCVFPPDEPTPGGNADSRFLTCASRVFGMTKFARYRFDLENSCICSVGQASTGDVPRGSARWIAYFSRRCDMSCEMRLL